MWNKFKRNRGKTAEKEVHTYILLIKTTNKDNFSSLGIEIQYTLLFCQLAFFLKNERASQWKFYCCVASNGKGKEEFIKYIQRVRICTFTSAWHYNTQYEKFTIFISRIAELKKLNLLLPFTTVYLVRKTFQLLYSSPAIITHGC